ncbi:MAG TPA: VWA domain-containing protein [Thermoanaerobaculia bacterium]
MNAAFRHTHSRGRLNNALLLSFLGAILIAPLASADNRILLTHGNQTEHSGDFRGIVDLIIDPGFEHASVEVSVDGQKLITGLRAPYRVSVDLGPTAVQHKISIAATDANGRRVRWNETINRGNLPLSVKLKAVDPGAGLFEVLTTAPKTDPIALVEVWDAGEVVASATSKPYRLTVPRHVVNSGFIQVTAKTTSGEEAADFWSAAGNIHVEEMQVRTVPIFVSVVDRNGVTQDNVDRSMFRILDKGAETTIVEFGKAFDQPISIALLIDASASMTYSMTHAVKAAREFVQNALKPGDRASVTAIHDVPRRRQSLTDDHAAVGKAIDGIEPEGKTALYDGLQSAIRELREEKNRRAIVVLTDGGDTSSMWSYQEIQKLAGESGIPTYFIAYEGEGIGDGVRDIEKLRFLANQTGGFVATATQQNLMARYGDIERDLRAQFAIKYEVSDFGKSNEWRPVRVVIASPKLSARTIQGYFTP